MLTAQEQVNVTGLKKRHEGSEKTVDMDGDLNKILYRYYHNETPGDQVAMVGRMNNAAKEFNSTAGMTVEGMQRYRDLLLLGKLYPARGVEGMYSKEKRGHKDPPNFGRFMTKTNFQKYERWFPYAFAHKDELDIALKGGEHTAGVSHWHWQYTCWCLSCWHKPQC